MGRGECTLPVCADEEARRQLQASSSTALHISLLRQDLPLCLELGISARLDSLGSPCLRPLSAGLTVSVSMPRFYMGAESWSSDPLSMRQALYSPNLVPS